MKKNYVKPQIEVVTVNCHILAGSGDPKITSLDNNAGFTLGNGGSGGGRSRGADDWDDED